MPKLRHETLQEPTLSGASVASKPQIHTAAMLVALIIRNYKVQRLDAL